LTVQSSDGVLFKVSSKDLQAYMGALPSADVLRPGDETIHLAETSEVLELLFQYTRPQRQPNLTGLPFSILASLAEAVEKYEVYPATEICRVNMVSVLLTYW
jgi:hypothetical protein